MSRLPMSFVLRDVDQARIDNSSIVVSDGDEDYPEALILRFTIRDPSIGAPPVIPLFGGHMVFLPDPTAPGHIPTADDIDLASESGGTSADGGYDNWSTWGYLIVSSGEDITLSQTIYNASSVKELVPNITWYWPVQITKTFLLKVIPNDTLILRNTIDTGTKKVKATDSDWAKYAISGFLSGTIRLRLKQDVSDSSKDTVSQILAVHTDGFPTVVMDTLDGAVNLWIAVGSKRSLSRLDDEKEDVVLAAAGEISTLHPTHPAAGQLPCRFVLISHQSLLRFSAADSTSSDNRLANAVLVSWPSGPKFFRVRFTFMGPQENEMLHIGSFAAQTIKIVDGNGNILIPERTLPLHGLVYVRQDVGQSVPTITISFPAGDLRITSNTGVLTSDTIVSDLSILGDDTSVVLQPIVNSDLAIYRSTLVNLIFPMQRSMATQASISSTLKRYEELLELGSAGILFQGTREPWKGVTKTHLEGFIAGQQEINIGIHPSPTFHPGANMLVWLFEGKTVATENGIFGGGWLDAESNLTSEFSIVTDADVAKIMTRVMLFWNYWGLDILNTHSSSNDNMPTLSNDLTSMELHNTSLNSRLSTYTSKYKISAPSLTEIDATIEVRLTGGKWQFRTKGDHIKVFTWLQSAEYLCRHFELLDLMSLTYDTFVPPFAAYFAYNAGVTNAVEGISRSGSRLFGWKQCANELGIDLANVGSVYEDWLLGIPRNSWEVSRSSTGGRLNALHFAALYHTYVAAFPLIL